MNMFNEGDRVRVDIPDRDDPDFEYHREQGEIIDIIQDSAGQKTRDNRDSGLYRVELDCGDVMDFRWRDLRLLQ
jgi:hypothetical protein